MTDHGEAETRSGLVQQELTERVLAGRIEVHRAGLGLPESAYEKYVRRQVHPRGIGFDRQVPLPVEYEGTRLDCRQGFDLLVEAVRAVAINSASQVVKKVL